LITFFAEAIAEKGSLETESLFDYSRLTTAR